MNEDRRPNKTPGHAFYCDCGECLGDGYERQFHRRGMAHNCPALDGQRWPGFGIYADRQPQLDFDAPPTTQDTPGL